MLTSFITGFKQPTVATTDSELSSFKHLPNDFDVERVLYEVIYSIRHVLSTKSEELEECLAETFVRATKEINYATFANRDRLCFELMKLIDIVDNHSWQSLFVSHLQNLSLPLLNILCIFMERCFQGESLTILLIFASIDYVLSFPCACHYVYQRF